MSNLVYFLFSEKHPQNPSKPSLEDPEKTVPKFQTEDPLIKKKPAPKDDTPEGPPEGPLLPKVCMKWDMLYKDLRDQSLKET